MATTRGVCELVTCDDPGGNRIELFYGAFVPKDPFVSPTGARFVTAAPGWGELGYGHSVVFFSNGAEARHFYFDLLGFRLSDYIKVGAATGVFTHCNPRHHSFALVAVPPAMVGLNHLMVEVADLDMVGRALDVVASQENRLSLTMGKHTNDHMESFYVKTPSGFMLEYGTGGRLIDDAIWVTATYDATSFWGHKNTAPTMAGTAAPGSAADVDN